MVDTFIFFQNEMQNIESFFFDLEFRCEVLQDAAYTFILSFLLIGY